MLKVPLLRHDEVLVAPGTTLWGGEGVWLGRRHLAVWWRGRGPWPEGCIPCPGDEENWYIVDHVHPTLATRLFGRRRRPHALVLRGVRNALIPRYRLVVSVRPCPEARAELELDPGPAVAVLEAESSYEAARRAIQARGGRQAQGVLLRIASGPAGLQAQAQGRDGSSLLLPLAGELRVEEPDRRARRSAALALVGWVSGRDVHVDAPGDRRVGGLVGPSGCGAGRACLGGRPWDGGQATEPAHTVCCQRGWGLRGRRDARRRTCPVSSQTRAVEIEQLSTTEGEQWRCRRLSIWIRTFSQV